MKKLTPALLSLIILLIQIMPLQAQENKELLSESTFSGLKFRSVGPAFMSGRIADIAIHPDNQNIWYVAVGSGGFWKTTNAGTTWKPIFDNQSVYSMGCVTIDPGNPHTIWLGTGENVGGRHVGYGDGIYRSDDDGQTWKNMGLKESQHISKIIVHPENSDIVWVAAQGPLWNKGGERGLYKSVDGGKSWKKVLGDNEWVGVTDVVIDPRNPDQLYAATWQRHRNVAAYMGGGPGTALYSSKDGGNNWVKLTTGLPKKNMGKIGLAISPQNPDVLYAAIELERRSGGVYRSTNRGASWVKMSDAVSGATGPHYYQELVACPHEFDRIYLIDVRIQVSDDGGKTFRRLTEEYKHSDNHSLTFRPDDPNYMLVGTDGGIYETFDLAKSWKYIANLPLTQFYKLALDDKEPFYTIYGGTQDNNTQGGPSRTDNVHGIRNSDWEVVLFADGHQPATEPGNPDIVYAEWQEGNLVRVDRTTGEIVYIQPQPREGEVFERYNWDAPILVSPHKPTRIYFASQRVWKSEDRGDSWTPISGDLTKNQERIALPIMDRKWSWDSHWDFYAMSNYNTITSLAESPKQEGLIYAGTDDGIIQVTEDGGQNWRKMEVGDLPGVPETAFVNDIKADLYDVNTVYIALDNHKFGDLKPYLLKSTDKGKSWKSIASNIPAKTLVWRLVQDHVNPKLLFLATEFGIYFTIDGGGKWIKLKGGVPTISFRDLAIQKRENDLVGASFGRSFYVLDDYSALRHVSKEQLNQEATLFPTRKAWWYMEKGVLGGSEKGSQGGALYTAKNPLYGAVFTYYLKDGLKSLKDVRKEREKKLNKTNADIQFPGYEALEKERRQEKPAIWLTVKDNEGIVVRRVNGKSSKGFHRIAWDLRYPAVQTINTNRSGNSRWQPKGMMVAPGEYTVTLSKEVDGVVTKLSEAMPFTVEQLRKGALEGSTPDQVVAFWKEIAELQRETSAASAKLQTVFKQIKSMEKALARSNAEPGELDKELNQLIVEVQELEELMGGNRSRDAVGDKNNPTIYSRLRVAITGTQSSTYGPTPMHKECLGIAQKEYEIVKEKLKTIVGEKIPALMKKLEEAGAPYIE